MKDKLLNLLHTTFKNKIQLEISIDTFMISSGYNPDDYKVDIHIISSDYLEATYYVSIAWIEDNKLNMINKNVFI